MQEASASNRAAGSEPFPIAEAGCSNKLQLQEINRQMDFLVLDDCHGCAAHQPILASGVQSGPSARSHVRGPCRLLLARSGLRCSSLHLARPERPGHGSTFKPLPALPCCVGPGLGKPVQQPRVGRAQTHPALGARVGASIGKDTPERVMDVE